MSIYNRFLLLGILCVSVSAQAAGMPVSASVFEKINSLQTSESLYQLVSPVQLEASAVFSKGLCPGAASDAVVSDDQFLQVINKTSGLSQTYVPPNLVDTKTGLKQFDKQLNCLTESTAIHLKQMADAMLKQKLNLYVVSGYRSYAEQQKLLKEQRKKYNSGDFDRAATPGFSEHQLGTSVDVASLTKSGTAFAKTPESVWLAAHAHEYGFVISYAAGNEYKTDYTAEPWHLRYVGVENATVLKAGNYTLAYIPGFYRPVYIQKFLDLVKKNIVLQK